MMKWKRIQNEFLSIWKMLSKLEKMSCGTSPQPSPNREGDLAISLPKSSPNREGDLVFSSSDRRRWPKAGEGKTVKL